VKQKPIISEALTSKSRPVRPLAPAAERLGVASTPLRLPQSILTELSDLARAKGISRNQLLLAFVDAGLRLEGRQGVEELAPGTTEWVRGDNRWTRGRETA
jgi:hypothetical protein